MMAESMRREVSLNSCSPVNSGPSSESASTVRRSRRKLLICTATFSGQRRKPEQNEVSRSKCAPRCGLLVIWCVTLAEEFTSWILVADEGKVDRTWRKCRVVLQCCRRRARFIWSIRIALLPGSYRILSVDQANDHTLHFNSSARSEFAV